MLTLRHSPFDLFDRLEQQLQTAERVPAAEVIDTPQSYEITLELPGVDKDSIDSIRELQKLFIYFPYFLFWTTAE